MPKPAYPHLEPFPCIGTKREETPIVLIPGVGAGAWYWAWTTPKLQAHYDVFAFNNPGTAGTPLPTPLSVHHIADVVGEEMAKAGITKAHIVGHSMGGFTAQRLAAHYPDLVEKLVLLSTGYGWPQTPKDALFLVEKTGKKYDELINGIWRKPEEYLRFVVGEKFPEAARFQDLLKQRQTSKGANAKGTLLAHTAAGGLFSSVTYVRTIQAPTLVISGEEDPLVTPEAGRKLAGQIPESTYLEKKGIGHLLPIEDDACADDILAFLAGTAIGKHYPQDAPLLPPNPIQLMAHAQNWFQDMFTPTK